MSEAQLSATIEERDLARSDLGASGDAALQEARSLRDTALASRNTVQVELARTRIDVLQVNSQLMEAVQQKIELSQQLEQWQVKNHSRWNQISTASQVKFGIRFLECSD